MCGIAGAIEGRLRAAPALEDIAWKMVVPLAHRGPDSGGVWVDAEAGIALGHRRLSIIDLSPAGAQPMVSTSGRYVLSYNGEIYNTDDLRSELEARGAVFRGRSDTEVLLEACAAWGVEQTARRLIGMFAFALWDCRGRCLYLVRDRMGIKPLYYSAAPERFLFASELTGLRAHPSFDRTVDREAVEAFLALDYVPAPHSIFRDARKLQPGTILRVSAAAPTAVEITPYWTLAEAAQRGAANRFPGSFEDATDELERLLSDAVQRRMVSDVPLGAFLSGGIDSSTVVALMQKQSAQPVRTFTIGFANAAFDEAPFAKAIAGHLGTDHTEHYLTPGEILEHGPAVLAHHDEPFADNSLLPTRFVSHLARRDVTVALTGDGGDELFGGYHRHLAAERIANHPAMSYGPGGKALYRGLIPLLPRRLRAATNRLHRGRAFEPLSTTEMRMLAVAIANPEQIACRLAHGRIRCVGGKGVAPRAIAPAMAAWLEESRVLAASERQQYIDAASYLPDDILTKVDRASMAVSLEARVPVLDHRIVEFAWRLPPAMKTDGSGTKRILRSLLARYVPEDLFQRPKRGFVGPLSSWLQGPLCDWADSLLRKEVNLRRGVVDPAAAEAARRRLRGGRFRPADFRQVVLAAWCDAHLNP
ncbi:MAG: asparagine synthase (glutamine-hydrolyzing) [Alphaproteobacteria bacterium]|nr:asparagine synthase (glutamine-hydrolyzing) [Alphaproteobacteria bacterium]